MPGATIVWKAWKENELIKLSNTDNGQGMNEAQIKKFEQNTTVNSSKHGLGLNLVKDMAQTIGWVMTLDSKQGSGTTFTLKSVLSIRIGVIVYLIRYSQVS